ncbi:hypothetical protein RHGRI_022567 [Rhododendron griersonianum]|uniref:Uncharacterized protein n=1 Tax=Rhododendron griersonianum TaxID=479676 RepID=A0AAV6J5N1_9ERIC|nr:hypothetical protein RHGRI_022567 [Rhododendron griersonianum]
MRKPMSLLQVIQYYEEKVEEMRRDEISDDFQCKNGEPPKTQIVDKDKLREALKMVEEEIANSDSADDLNCMC